MGVEIRRDKDEAGKPVTRWWKFGMNYYGNAIELEHYHGDGVPSRSWYYGSKDAADHFLSIPLPADVIAEAEEKMTQRIRFKPMREAKPAAAFYPFGDERSYAP